MEKILDIAAYIIDKYKEVTGEKLDEMKLHKLLYFTQRENIALTGELAFKEPLEGWKYGHVSKDVRNHYIKGEGRLDVQTNQINQMLAYVANNVILEYGALASWRLSQLSHKELSWKNSRVGLKDDDYGNNVINVKDIYEDAKKIRPYDHMWDMYYDEFEDLEC